jgi:hypothetical protein
MKTMFSKWALAILFSAALIRPSGLHAQGYGSSQSVSPSSVMGVSRQDAQRNTLRAVFAQVDWFRNATRTAPNFPFGGCQMLQDQFELLRAQYNNQLKSTLTARQLTLGANDLAELDAGLDVIEEALVSLQSGADRFVFSKMCRVLNEAMREWGKEMDRVSRRLKIGSGLIQ